MKSFSHGSSKFIGKNEKSLDVVIIVSTHDQLVINPKMVYGGFDVDKLKKLVKS
jgi:hypothetical protein